MGRSWRVTWLAALLAGAAALPQDIQLVSTYPANPLQPLGDWRWRPVGENGHVYRFPLEWGPGEPAPPRPKAPRKKAPRVEVAEMASFQDWLREMVDAGVFGQELGMLLNSLSEAAKTVTAVTRFPITRQLAAASEGAFTAAADSAFRDEITASSGAAGMMFSSEDATPVVLDDTKNISVSYDPLLCSANVDVGLPHGSIFMVSSLEWTGAKPIAAGYALYGSATVLVVSVGRGVAEFTLDEDFQFRLTGPGVEAPARGDYFSGTEQRRDSRSSSALGQFLAEKKNNVSTHRPDLNCLVGDVHRILKKGGIYLDPATEKAKKGRHSITFRLAPLAFLLEQAGGAASNGSAPLLSLEPRSHKETSPAFLGSSGEVARLEELLAREPVEVEEPAAYFPLQHTADVSPLFKETDTQDKETSVVEP